ncbi:MAG: efflux RND transporter periplasmic adaptor subunit [Akkermansiaceae bacterium]
MSEKKSSKGSLSVVIKIISVIAIILLGFAVMKFLSANGPEAVKEIPEKVIPVVETITAQASSEQLYINSQGQVEPSRQTQAASEIMGRVIQVSDEFESGGVFSQGEILLEIDSADYVSALATAEASLADAKLALIQEQSRAAQAERDWKKLGRGEASDLVLRKPQIVSAEARIKAAEASVSKSVRDLDRTKLRAPYDCRVEATYTDLGSYISPGMKLADLYSLDAFEVRVPVTLEEIGYLKPSEILGSDVALSAKFGNVERNWRGKVVRNESAVDRQTMTIYLVVEVMPEGDDAPYIFPPSGLFVNAEIKGKMTRDVINIPRSALRSDNTLLTLGADNTLKIIPVEIARTLRSSILVSKGLEDGVKVIVSPMETAVEGMELRELAKTAE